MKEDLVGWGGRKRRNEFVGRMGKVEEEQTTKHDEKVEFNAKIEILWMMRIGGEKSRHCSGDCMVDGMVRSGWGDEEITCTTRNQIFVRKAWIYCPREEMGKNGLKL